MLRRARDDRLPEESGPDPDQRLKPDQRSSPDGGLHTDESDTVRLSGRERRFRRVRWLYVWLAGVSVAGLALRTLVGPVIRWTSSYDDENQMRVANAILHGQWMGEWGTQPVASITLSKAPGYPIFVAVLNHVGLSPRIGAYLLYLAGALLLVLALRSRIGSGWAGGLYAVLAFCPDVMSVSFSRPYRDQLVAALTLLAIGAATALGMLLRRRGRLRWQLWLGAGLLTLVLAGTLGWLAITRADTVWVVVTSVGVLLVVVGPVVRRLDRWGWGRVAASIVVVGVALLAVPTAVATMNERHYGVRLTDDYSQGGFSDAVRVWMSVQAPGGEPFQLVTRPQRQAVYAVSAAAREVQGSLESPQNIWVGKGCGTRPTGWGPCTEYGAFFGWAIRDAAYDAGHTTASDFQAYFVRLAREIGDACANGTLTCGSRGLSADLPPLDQVSLRVAASGTFNLIGGSLKFSDNMEAPQADVPADPALVALWEDTMPDVRGLVDLLGAGQTPDTIVQQSSVDVLKFVYSTLAAVAVLALLVALGTGLLFRSVVGRLALVCLAGWLAYTAIVAVVFAATNRQFVQVVPSYTLAGQALLLTGLVLSVSVLSRAAAARLRLSVPDRSERRAAESPPGPARRPGD